MEERERGSFLTTHSLSSPLLYPLWKRRKSNDVIMISPPPPPTPYFPPSLPPSLSRPLLSAPQVFQIPPFLSGFISPFLPSFFLSPAVRTDGVSDSYERKGEGEEREGGKGDKIGGFWLFDVQLSRNKME